MSLMGTLGKVAMGVIVAKGVGKMMGGGNTSGGGLLGSLMGAAAGGSSGGGLGGLLGGLAGGNSQQGGGLGGLLGGLTGGQQGGSGGLGGLLSGLTGGQGGAGGADLGGLLSGLAGGGAAGAGIGGLLNSLGGGQQGGSAGNLGDLFNTALMGGEPEVSDEDEQNAKIMLQAMINAAKADGKLDDEEKQKLTAHLNEDNNVSAEEVEMVQQMMQGPSDVNAVINSAPQGMEQQIYLMSLLAITLDTQEEAQYMDQLAKGLNISPEMANNIHEQLGAPQLYS